MHKTGVTYSISGHHIGPLDYTNVSSVLMCLHLSCFGPFCEVKISVSAEVLAYCSNFLKGQEVWMLVLWVKRFKLSYKTPQDKRNSREKLENSHAINKIMKWEISEAIWVEVDKVVRVLGRSWLCFYITAFPIRDINRFLLLISETTLSALNLLWD